MGNEWMGSEWSRQTCQLHTRLRFTEPDESKSLRFRNPNQTEPGPVKITP